MMKTLSLVPHQALARKRRQSSIALDGRLLPFSIAGLVSQLLKEQGVPYRESNLLEELAIWEAVWQLADQLDYYASMIEFPGFIRDLHQLFLKLSSKELTLEQLPEEQQIELLVIYRKYQANLEQNKVLAGPEQIVQAMEYWPESQLAKEIGTVEIYYLGSLSQLEKEFIQLITKGKQVVQKEFSPFPGLVSGSVAQNPQEEVQAIAGKIVKLLEAGVEPHQIGVSAPQLSDYIPIITPIFSAFNIPWTTPNLSLAETPLGKAVAALLQVLNGRRSKQELRQLISVGCGLPVKLTLEERRAFKIAPESLVGFHAWQKLLDQYPTWQNLLSVLQGVNTSGKRLLSDFVAVFQELLATFGVEDWPTIDETAWAIHQQAWDGLRQIFLSLSEGRTLVTFQQFSQLIQNAISHYNLPQPLTFQQQVNVTQMQQLVGMEQYCIFMLGMTEDSFPQKSKRNWLTKEIETDDSLELYEQLLHSATQIHLSYPESDLDDGVNIASQIFPEESDKFEASPLILPPGSFGNYPAGKLQDPQIIEKIINRYQNKHLSVSRLNVYAACPFKFFCEELLELRADEVADEEITALEEGNLLHLVLKQYWELKGRKPILELLEEVYQQQHQLLTKRIVKIVEQFNKQDVALVENSQYQPKYLEHYFDNLEINTSSGTLKLRGIIDRIDVNSDGTYVIYDYKTGASPSVNEILSGADVQLQVYTLAASKSFGEAPVGLAYYTIRDARRRGLWADSNYRRLGVYKTKAVLPDETWQTIPEMFYVTIQEHATRIFSGEFPVDPHKDSICRFCEYRGICRREG